MADVWPMSTLVLLRTESVGALTNRYALRVASLIAIGYYRRAIFFFLLLWAEPSTVSKTNCAFTIVIWEHP